MNGNIIATIDSMKPALSSTQNLALEIPWADHIPRKCPDCSAKMNNKVNLSIGLSKEACLLKRIAPWSSLVVLALAFLYLVFSSFSSVRSFGQGSPMALVAMIVGPPVMLTIIANCMTKKYKLQCHQCGHQSDYSL